MGSTLTEPILQTFVAATRATLALGAVGALGWALARAGVLTPRRTRWVAAAVIKVCVPVVVFTSIVRHFDPSSPLVRLLIPIFGAWVVAWHVIGGVAVWLAGRVVGRPWRDDKPLLALAVLNNSLFVPAPILLALLPGEQATRAIFYITCYLFYMQAIQWSVGVWLIGGRTAGWRELAGRILNPPVVAIIVTYGLLLIPGGREALRPDLPLWRHVAWAVSWLVGPLAMIVLGGLIHEAPPRWRGSRRDILVVATLRAVVIPAATLGALFLVRHEWLLGLVVLLEAAAPPATNLSVIAAYYDGPVRRITSALLPSYVVTMVTIPFYVAAYRAFFAP